MKNTKLVVLVSGNGSNLQALINAALANAAKIPASTKSAKTPNTTSATTFTKTTTTTQVRAEISAVISNRPNAYALKRAESAGIETAVLDHTGYPDRESFDSALAKSIDHYQPDFVILAGFMRILSTPFVEHYLGRLINIHPSLLPQYPGLNTHQRVLDAGETQHGASVHFVIPKLDAGPVIIQGMIDVSSTKSAEHLAARVLKVEHQIYPMAVAWLAQSKVCFDQGKAWLNNEPLPACGYQVRIAE